MTLKLWFITTAVSYICDFNKRYPRTARAMLALSLLIGGTSIGAGAQIIARAIHPEEGPFWSAILISIPGLILAIIGAATPDDPQPDQEFYNKTITQDCLAAICFFAALSSWMIYF